MNAIPHLRRVRRLLHFVIPAAALLLPGLLPAQDQMPSSFLLPTNTADLPGKGAMSQWPPFPKLWAERRTVFWNHRAEDQHAVVFLGDSITQGWNSLAATFPNFKVANRGIGGDTTRGVLFRLKEDVIDLEPEAVVLLIGTNDIGNGGTPEQAAANIAEIVSRLEQSNPKMPIILCRVMPSREGVADSIKELNRRIDQLAHNDKRLTLCDTWTIYATPDGTCKKDEFPDMLHPNAAGYEKWADALKPIFDPLKLK
jgi:lysophospholipase L1-like esterase